MYIEIVDKVYIYIKSIYKRLQIKNHLAFKYKIKSFDTKHLMFKKVFNASL